MQFNVIYLEFMYFMVLRLYDKRVRATNKADVSVPVFRLLK